jgi:soluble lytic murein transglycosylase-like protein
MKRLSALLLTVLAVGCLLTLHPGTASAADTNAEVPEPPALTEADTIEEDAGPSIYNSNVPLDKDLQQYLYDLCTERGLDYKMALAIIRHESGFNAKALGGKTNYGLFQINKGNHKALSAALKTENKPFDPRININWGTHILSCLFTKYEKSYGGEDLLKAVLSAYNRGEGGFKKYGFAKSYIKSYYKNLEVVNSWFE